MYNSNDLIRYVCWADPGRGLSKRLFAGYDQGVFGGIIVTQDFLDTMGNPDPNLQGTIVSLYDIGW